MAKYMKFTEERLVTETRRSAPGLTTKCATAVAIARSLLKALRAGRDIDWFSQFRDHTSKTKISTYLYLFTRDGGMNHWLLNKELARLGGTKIKDKANSALLDAQAKQWLDGQKALLKEVEAILRVLPETPQSAAAIGAFKAFVKLVKEDTVSGSAASAVLARLSSAASIVKAASGSDQSPLQKEFQEFFGKMLERYEVDSPAELSDKQKSEFFNEISELWTKGKGPKAKAAKVFAEE